MDFSTFGGNEEEVFHWCRLSYDQLHLHDHLYRAHPRACSASTTLHSSYTSAMETFKQQEEACDPAREGAAAFTSGPFRPSIHRRNPRVSPNTQGRDSMEIHRRPHLGLRRDIQDKHTDLPYSSPG